MNETMSDKQATALFHGSADQIPVGPAPDLDTLDGGGPSGPSAGGRRLGRPGRRTVLVALCSAAAVGAVIAASLTLGSQTTSAPPATRTPSPTTDGTARGTVTVPDVIGLPPALATRVLDDAGLRVAVSLCPIPTQSCVPQPPAPVGSQDPDGGSVVAAGDRVQIAPRVAVGADPRGIEGSWRVTWSDPASPYPETVAFRSNGEFGVNGCNLAGGRYVYRPDNSFALKGGVDTTTARCRGEAVAAGLDRVAAFTVRGGRATGYDQDGREILTMTAIVSEHLDHRPSQRGPLPRLHGD